MMMSFTLWDVISGLAYFALLYAGGPLLVAAILLLTFKTTRRQALSRRLAYTCLALAGLFLICAWPILRMFWRDHERQVAFDAATHHLASPQVFGGVSFPAGSTVHVREDGRPEFGSLVSPARVDGLVLIGDFRLAANDDDTLEVMEGTLAQPADIHGIPCGSGAVMSQVETTRCVLGRDYDFAGHLLATGKMLEVYRSPLGEPAMLRFGTLAQPELLYDVLWPAGTIIGSVDKPPARMAHGPGPDSLLVQVCLPSGLSAPIDGATLHGLLSYDIQEDRRSVSPVCSMLPGEPVGDDGYAQVGTSRFRWGDRPVPGAPWQWSEPIQPSTP